MKHIFLLNPVSGKEDATRTMQPALCSAAQRLGLDYACEITQRVGHATDIARRWAESGQPVRLYACSGDGTLNEVFAGVYPFKNAEVASIPCGSGNDFVRTFGRPEEFLNLEDNLVGTAVTIDLIAANSGVSAAICSVGIDSEVAYGIPKFRRIPFCGGHMAYNLSILQRLCSPMGEHLRVEIDGQVIEDDLLIATVCNGVAYGGGYYAAPMAQVQDGLLEVILVKKIGRLRIASVLSQYKAGKHICNYAVVLELQDVMRYYRAKKVVITPLKKETVIVNIDGECGPAKGLCAEVMPGAARFVLPAAVYARYTQECAARENETERA